MKKIGIVLMCLTVLLSSCEKAETQNGLEYSQGAGASNAIQQIDKLINKTEADKLTQSSGLNHVTESDAQAYSKANFIMLMDMKREFEKFNQQVEMGTVPLTDADSLSIMLQKAKSDGYKLTKIK